MSKLSALLCLWFDFDIKHEKHQVSACHTCLSGIYKVAQTRRFVEKHELGHFCIVAKREHGHCPRFVELSFSDQKGYFQAGLGWCCGLGFQWGWRFLFPFCITKHFQHLWMSGYLEECSPLVEELKQIWWFSRWGRRLKGGTQGWIQKVKRGMSILCSMVPRRMEGQAQIISSVPSDSRSSSWEPQWSKAWVGLCLQVASQLLPLIREATKNSQCLASGFLYGKTETHKKCYH